MGHGADGAHRGYHSVVHRAHHRQLTTRSPISTRCRTPIRSTCRCPALQTFLNLNLNSGSKLTTLKQMMPDIDGDPTNLLYSVFYRNSRSARPGLQTARNRCAATVLSTSE